MDQAKVDRWLCDLKSEDASKRDHATTALWQLWFQQKGVHGLHQLMEAQTLLESNRVSEAESLLSAVIEAQPDFAEAWNRRAVLHYTQQRYWKAISDCQQAVKLMPCHFGALHGLGLSHKAVGNYVAAIQAFRQALEIQPYAIVNQKLILECTAKLG